MPLFRSVSRKVFSDSSAYRSPLSGWRGFALIIGAVVAVLLDGWAYQHISWPGEGTDLHKMFRVLGYLPMTILLCLGISAIDRARGVTTGWMVFISAAASGIAAEILKMLIGRERPIAHDGVNYFKPFLQGFVDHSNLSLPSSHAAVAFGTAWMLCYCYPKGKWLWIFAACACAWTRLAARAHWLSDCYAAAVVALFTAWLIRLLIKPRRFANLPVH
ncbi:MAG TPA: phosphatase PAP2 family protein [Phycisphaeraceae bacterium]|nr:phosphatase PAP2 family protein [Phycisphaeraceae bacterium]